MSYDVVNHQTIINTVVRSMIAAAASAAAAAMADLVFHTHS